MLLTSCGFDGITGSGKITTQNRNVGGNFTKVDASRGLDVVIEQSGAQSVTVEADDNIQEHILTKVDNGTLTITSDKGSYSNATKKVTVKMPVIDAIETGGGVSLTSTGVLKSDELIIKATSGSSIKMNIDAGKVTTESSSGSTIKLSGKVATLGTSSSSGSTIEAQNLMAENVTAQASSGSSTDVNALKSFNGQASSGGSLQYKGQPEKVEKHESSGGSVSAK